MHKKHLSLGERLRFLLTYDAFLRCVPWQLSSHSEFLYCRIRKKWAHITPEEQVRQYCLYLLQALNYPLSHLAVERAFMYLDRRKRLDVLAYDSKMQPFLLVECKRSDVTLQEEDLQQLLTYNAHWRVPYMALFNGHNCYCLRSKSSSRALLCSKNFPVYPR